MRRKFAGLVLMGVLVTGCSLEAPDGSLSRLTVRIDHPPSSPLASFLSSSPPSDISGFTCFGVNIMGPGILPSGGKTGDYSDLGGVLAGTSYCSYRGITSSPIPNTAGSHVVSLQVPTGPQRLIQLVGVEDPTDVQCSRTDAIGSDDDSQTEYFEIGRVVTSLFSSQSVAIPDTFDTLNTTDQAARRVNCDNDTSTPTYESLIRSESSLIGYWPLTDTAGGTVTSQAPSGTLPTLAYAGPFVLGQPGPLQGAANSDQNYAVQLNTAGEVQGTVSINFTTALSVEAWVKTPANGFCSGGAGIVYFNTGGSGNKILLSCTGSVTATLNFQVVDSDLISDTASSSTVINDGSWHHVVGVWATGTSQTKVYVDGSPGGTVGINSLTNVSIQSGTPILQFGVGINDIPSGSLLAHVAVYNSVLTQAQVTAHFQKALHP